MMESKPSIFNKWFLFACISMYFGTGWSLILFSFPIASTLTPANYYYCFVPQVTAATHFFTYMTALMCICACIWIWQDWHQKSKWFGIAILFAVFLATALTLKFIIPYNVQLANHVKDASLLKEILHNWMNLNIIRVSIWTVQWLIMVWYFIKNYKMTAS